MRDDAAEKLADYYGELDVIQQQLALAITTGVTEVGSDKTGAVRVTVDTSGRVMEVAFAPRWRDQIGIDTVTTAIHQAMESALAARDHRWEREVTRKARVTAPSARPLFPLPERDASLIDTSSADGTPSHRPRVVLEEMLCNLESLEQNLKEAITRTPSTDDLRHSGNSTARHVAVDIDDAGDLVDIKCQQQWLVRAPAINVSREVTEAFHAAYIHLDGTIGMPTNKSSLRRPHVLTSDR